MSRQILMSVIVIYLCIVNIIYSYKLGNKNVVENNKDIGELCSLIKEGETLSVTDVLGSSEVLSYLQMAKDKQFIYTTSLIIKAYNVLDINTKFTAKHNTDKPTHQISISLRNSLNYQFINLVGYAALNGFQSVLTEVGLPKVDNTSCCTLGVTLNSFTFNVIMFRYPTSTDVFFLPLLNSSILPSTNSPQTSIEQTGSYASFKILPLVFKVKIIEVEEITTIDVLRRIKITLIIVLSVLALLTMITFGSFLTNMAK